MEKIYNIHNIFRAAFLTKIFYVRTCKDIKYDDIEFLAGITEKKEKRVQKLWRK